MSYQTLYVSEGKWVSKGPGPSVHSQTQARADAATYALNSMLGSLHYRALLACAQKVKKAYEYAPAAHVGWEELDAAYQSALKALAAQDHATTNGESN